MLCVWMIDHRLSPSLYPGSLSAGGQPVAGQVEPSYGETGSINQEKIPRCRSSDVSTLNHIDLCASHSFSHSKTQKQVERQEDQQWHLFCGTESPSLKVLDFT